MKGLNEIIIRSQVKSFHSVRHLVAGGEKQDRCLKLRASDLGQNGPTVALRQDDIKNDKVHFLGKGVFESLFSIFRHIDHKAVLNESASHKAGDFWLVFDN